MKRTLCFRFDYVLKKVFIWHSNESIEDADTANFKDFEKICRRFLENIEKEDK